MRAQQLGMERSKIKKLNDMEVKEQYQVKISNKFAALENYDDDDDDDDDDSAFVRYWRKWEYNGKVHELFMQFEKACDTVR
jgi:hypothetical protein